MLGSQQTDSCQFGDRTETSLGMRKKILRGWATHMPVLSILSRVGELDAEKDASPSRSR